MKIQFDIDYDDAVSIRDCVSKHLDIETSCELLDALDNAIQNENERRYEAHQESLMETGGPDDSKYRQDLRDAGRGHLLR